MPEAPEDFGWVLDFLANRPESPIAGYYNNNYICHHEGRRYVVRVPIASCDEMDIRLVPEAHSLLFLGLNGFPAPRVVYQDPSGRFVVHRYVEGLPLQALFYDRSPLPNWVPIELATQVRQLHALDATGFAQYCESLAASPESGRFFCSLIHHVQGIHAGFFRDFCQVFRRLGIPASPLEVMMPRVRELVPRAFVFSHCDIHRKNILVDERGPYLVILDWELVLVADPLYDVAVHFHKMGYSPVQEELFLGHYCSSGEDLIFLQGQIEIYRDLERIKSAIVDAVRYSKDLQKDHSEVIRMEYARRYFRKLNHARQAWRLPASIGPTSPEDVLAALAE